MLDSTHRFMPPHTNSNPSFVALRPEDLDLAGRSREMWRVLKSDAGLMARIAASSLRDIIYRLHRQDHRSDPLELFLTYVVKLAALRTPEAFFRRQQLLIAETIDACFAGAPKQTLAELDRLDPALEFQEDRLQTERLIDGVATPDEMDAEAAALEEIATAHAVRARLLRRGARQQRAGLTLAATG